MVGFDSVEGFDALPRRIFLEGEQRPFSDPDGFIRPIEGTVPVRDLLASSATLVIAPPWTGKTFVSKQIKDVLSRSGRLCERTSFESAEAPGRNGRLLPSWWPSWQEGASPAWWLVDALDEDDRREDRRAREIVDLVGDLPPEARSRLHLILFCRLSEIPLWCDDVPDLRRFRLAGADRETAKILVGSERFDRVCELIRRNGLQSLASLPIVLEYLRDKGVDTELTEESVWRGVLKDLLHDQRSGPWRSERFEAAQRLAVLSTFCGEKALLDLSALETLFLSGAPPQTDLRRAAGEVLKRSAAFEPAESGFRFAQDHVRQWLAALALQEMPFSRVKPLLTLDSGEPDLRHKGLMSFLGRISRYAGVRDWVLEIALRELDQLQEIARLAPRGLRLRQAQRLGGFKLAGMGAEIARRLSLELSPAEQELLLDLALMLDASEAVAPATQILQDHRQNESVRELAASLLAALGAAEHLMPLVPWVEARQEDLGKDALSILEMAFYQLELWSYEKAAERALSEHSLRRDWLQCRLADDLTLDRARWLLGHSLPKVGRPLPHLLTRALEKVCEQSIPEKTDAELLSPFLGHADWQEREQILQFLKRSPDARRKLFQKGLASDPHCQDEATWIWRDVLDGEDAEWLLDLFRAQREPPPWLLRRLHSVARLQGVPQALRRCIRQTLRDADAEALKAFDEDQKSFVARTQNLHLKRQEKRAGTPIYQLEPLVRKTLDSEKIELRHKMLHLSWYCFESPSYRPSNLSGRWDDLLADMRGEVIAVCREALAQCPSTEIPASSSYSRWTSWEAACFDRLTNEDDNFVLTPEMVWKWLPALLRTWVPGSGYEPTLRRCFEVDRQLTEDLFAGAVHRAVLAEKSPYVLQNLPPHLWSERFSGLLEAIVADPNVSAERRIDLLARIGDVFPRRALPIAQVWAQAPDASLREAGIDMLLMLAPEEGWERLKTLADRENAKEVVRRMRSLHHYGPSAAFGSWPVAQLVELVELLLSCFVPEEDPQWGEEQEDPDDEDDDLRSVRDHIPQLLYRRDREGDGTALETLAARHRHIREWLDDVKAQQAAESVIAGLGRGARSSSPGRFVPLEDMIRLLLDVRFRLLRTADDLLNVVLEEIRQIQDHARQHLSMLYHPQPLKKREERKRLHEDALQAYIACRLADRLPHVLGERGLKVEPISIDRETLSARNTRNDLKIQASSIAKGHLAVIIEIKWSDHRDVSTSLVHQLGEDYLLNNGHTHGLYLVGWCGEPGNREGMQRALEEQARLFIQDHPTLRIDPVVVDLSWKRPDPRSLS
jgi:hypothetical protein